MASSFVQVMYIHRQSSETLVSIHPSSSTVNIDYEPAIVSESKVCINKRKQKRDIRRLT